ncbi:hypothetical protein M3P21_18460 [Ruegeria sp. 2012CJ41-6]|uniref:Antifreeze glycopeptide polyprotein n=1 Tax=Ruegeria spongiae TaxID=2942209 RepID=A0ABT0Q6S8_9RHOB|nr:hypothetical protein [Ruegeria spongiae]MCL6285517.1 hypothetical protein [Ruegeria spongiae]
MRTRLALLLAALPVLASAQHPLSAIEWLNDPPPVTLPGTVLMEPPVTTVGRQPEIAVRPLDAPSPAIGLVPSAVTGLPVDLWRGSDPARLAQLIAQVPVRNSPAMQKLLYSLLLTEATAPAGTGAEEILLLARLDRLLYLGATDPAQNLAQVAGATRNADRFRRWFDATLLTGDEDRSCEVLASAPHLSPGYGALIFCQARRGDWPAAALTLEAAHALELLEPDRLDLMDRFLSPDLFEGAPPLPRPDAPDPLTFRLYETIGERLPTAPMPRAFATADLRDVAGWKAQLEAAERLTRIGALTPNHLLGLYTERKASASGGVWDRVDALRRFDKALQSGSPEAVAKTLPAAWSAMREVQLEVPFAELFSEQLDQIAFTDPDATRLTWEIALLAGARPRASDGAAASLFLAALANGNPRDLTAPDTTGQAIAEGFAAPPLRPELQDMINGGRLGEAILEAMILFGDGASGNPADLTAAIALFRAVGLEDTARQAGLQLMLLDRG